MTRVLILALLFVSSHSIVAQPYSLDAIQEEDLTFRALSVFGRDRLPVSAPSSYTITEHAKCGTPLLTEIATRWGSLSKATQATLANVFQRPTTQRSIFSPNDRFQIHFDLTGTHAVSSVDADGNGTPDYVDEVADTFEDTWELQVTDLGYREPPQDSDGRFDVFIRQLGNRGVYGLTFPDPGGITTASYMEIDNDYSESIYQTRNLDGMRVTVAHEFFHAVQFGYFASFDAAWWQEATATWMEDVAYDEINDYFQYVSVYLGDPEAPLDRFSWGDLRPFGASVFAHHLSEVYGRDQIRATWESLGSRTPTTYDINDIGDALPGGFAAVLPRFHVWNYFAGSRHRSGYYEEGIFYSDVPTVTLRPAAGAPENGNRRVDHFGASYLTFSTADLSGGLRVSFDLTTAATWSLSVLLITDSAVEVFYPSMATIDIPNPRTYREIVVVPAVVSSSGVRHNADYSITIDSGIQVPSHLIGDFDGNGDVGFSDFVDFAGSFGASASDDSFTASHDLDADGEVDFADFLVFASHFGDSL